MKTTLPLLGLLIASLLVTSARAALPAIYYTVDSFYLGNSVTFAPTVADDDMDMDYVTFSVTGPGVSMALSPNVNVPSVGQAAQTTGVTVSKSWTPSVAGLWTVSITVHSLNGSTSLDRTFDVLPAGTRTIYPVTVASGSSQIYQYSGELVTATNTSGDSVVVQTGGALILWSGGRIKLEPGFKAQAGTNLFWAAIDHNMNGYSDIEEVTDTDGDGMPDAWEVDHGLNPIINDAASDLDGDGMSNLAEYLAGRDPNNKADGSVMPTIPGTTGVYNMVLKTPSSYYGLNQSTWALTAVTAP